MQNMYLHYEKARFIFSNATESKIWMHMLTKDLFNHPKDQKIPDLARIFFDLESSVLCHLIIVN